MKREKKSNVTFIFVITMISILGFFIVFNSFFKNSEFISSESQTLLCKSLIQIKEKSKVGIGVYLYELGNKCNVEKLVINNKDKDSTFKPIAESMNRCWFKYGEGKVDFMSNWQNSGSWCFQCAEVNYKDKSKTSYSYEEFIRWSKENKFKTSDGEKTYNDYLNLFKLDIKNKDSNNYLNNIKKIKINDDETLTKNLQSSIFTSYLSLMDLQNSYKLKQLNPNEKNYIVFKYYRIEKDFFNSASVQNSAELTIKGATLKFLSDNKLVFKSLKKVSKLFLKRPIVSSLILAGGALGIKTNDNYIQYIDIMNQEEYYRECGTQRYPK